MINAIFYPIFIRSNGTSDTTGQDFFCFLLALMVLGIFMLIGSFIYAIVDAKKIFGRITWGNIQYMWCDTFCYVIGWTYVISPIVIMFFIFLIYYIKQILF